MSHIPCTGDQDADAFIHTIRRRLIAIADEPPYRYINTTPEDRAEYEAKKRSFTGYALEEILAVESRLDIRFPAVYRAFLHIMGISNGDLFCGSNVASLENYDQLQEFAQDLIHECHVNWQLDKKAFVFLGHQGYTFNYFIADGRFDSPVHQYVENDQSGTQCSPGFAEFIDAEVSLAEQNNQNIRDAGGYFLTIADGCVSQEHPTRNSGIRPLDLPDQTSEASKNEKHIRSLKPWWRFGKPVVKE
ncbi:hypothetical protein CA54_35220 [Symmachiella macrocystis]|uniref:Knr4/Smi1-like domain-containing protein n=1 Tax=Symmachiella macrocystis TaxID=2527985 RepID=A0A5C6BR10_9PLAN|nr:SMI1/KNR4 family protein [Symmachiella macrocystis]TWU14653.1 hypothetical protein CA54_35220 [Symmachiella macrocystis]